MVELRITGQRASPEDIAAIDSQLRAQYPAYTGLTYAAARGLFRLMFSAMPDESEQLTIAGIVNRAPVFGRKITNLFERRPTWNQFSR